MASQNIVPINFPNLKEKPTGKISLLGAVLLFGSFVVTFLFLYSMYICTHRRGPDGGGGGNSNAPSAGLDPATINSLPVFSYGSTGKKPTEGECAICLGFFQEGESVKVLPLCNHRFHSDCVDKWLRTRTSCPLCRGGVTQLSRQLGSGVP